MKLIHTADWHLGNSMHDMDRAEESKQFLKWLKERIVELSTDCLVVSGDIFDTATPSVEARKQYFQFLASLLDTCCKNIVLVGGNHDSGVLLDAPRDLLEAFNIQMVGSLGERSVEDLVKELTDESGNVIGVSAAVPYVRETELRRFRTNEAEDFAKNSFEGLYSAVYEAAEKKRAGRDIPIVATGHLYASKLEGRPENDEGKDAKGHGLRDIVGNLGTIPVSVFPEGFDYVALGHIHYSTMVAKNPKVRYSGSPFVLGFDEVNIPHYVLAIDLEKGKEPVVEKIETPQYFGFKRISGSIESIVAELRQLKKLLPDAAKDNLQILMVSVDPNRDTTEQLQLYLQYFDPEFIGLTGELADIQSLSNALSIPFIPGDTSKPRYTVDHSGNLAILSPDGRQYGFIRAPLDIRKLAEQLPKIIHQ